MALFGYIKVTKITSKIKKEVQRRMDKNIENSDWNEGIMFVLAILKKEI